MLGNAAHPPIIRSGARLTAIASDSFGAVGVALKWRFGILHSWPSSIEPDHACFARFLQYDCAFRNLSNAPPVSNFVADSETSQLSARAGGIA
jgi:hypothetical protein